MGKIAERLRVGRPGDGQETDRTPGREGRCFGARVHEGRGVCEPVRLGVLCCLALEALRTGLIPSREREWGWQEIGGHLQRGMGFRAESFETGEG
ncbi:MAG: hypothetical protein RLZZ244_1861 [Verrucomicrobiota bacterium]